MNAFWIFLGIAALSIPRIIKNILNYRKNIKENKIKELELQKQILELEIKTQESKIRLLEEESNSLDKSINE